jgi:hypothetical protein
VRIKSKLGLAKEDLWDNEDFPITILSDLETMNLITPSSLPIVSPQEEAKIKTFEKTQKFMRFLNTSYIHMLLILLSFPHTLPSI